jgi:acid phosphatase type 7
MKTDTPSREGRRRVFKTWWLVGAAVLGASLLGGWTGSGEARAAGDPVLVGAGDIASCASSGDEATARLLDNMRGTVFAVGDTAYPDGTAAQFADCYGPSWGRHKVRTRPAVGNHEYYTPGAAGYFGYFGDAAGDPAEAYYSYDRGAWHIVVLNSNCSEVPCAEGSAQERWLEADLAASPTRCTLAYFHHPRFSSAGNNFDVTSFWQDLYAAGAEVVLSGHTHNYERFAPQRPDDTRAGKRGIREFVVGTGGVSLNPFGAVKLNSQARNSDAHGVLKLTLHPGSYDWKFVPVAGETFTDSGNKSCH